MALPSREDFERLETAIGLLRADIGRLIRIQEHAHGTPPEDTE